MRILAAQQRSKRYTVRNRARYLGRQARLRKEPTAGTPSKKNTARYRSTVEPAGLTPDETALADIIHLFHDGARWIFHRIAKSRWAGRTCWSYERKDDLIEKVLTVEGSNTYGRRRIYATQDLGLLALNEDPRVRRPITRPDQVLASFLHQAYQVERIIAEDQIFTPYRTPPQGLLMASDASYDSVIGEGPAIAAVAAVAGQSLCLQVQPIAPGPQQYAELVAALNACAWERSEWWGLDRAVITDDEFSANMMRISSALSGDLEALEALRPRFMDHLQALEASAPGACRLWSAMGRRLSADGDLEVEWIKGHALPRRARATAMSSFPRWMRMHDIADTAAGAARAALDAGTSIADAVSRGVEELMAGVQAENMTVEVLADSPMGLDVLGGGWDRRDHRVDGAHRPESGWIRRDPGEDEPDTRGERSQMAEDREDAQLLVGHPLQRPGAFVEKPDGFPSEDV
jgi:hypothetical protein